MGLGRSLERIAKHARMGHLGSTAQHEVQQKNILAMWPVSFSMVLQTLQLFNSLHFTMLSAMQGIPEHSQRGFTNPTVSQLFNSLYFNVFAAMQGTPGHTNRRIANPTVVQLSTFYHALCYAQHS